MKKLLLTLSIVIILLSCSNGNMETEREPEFYPYEVTDIKHEFLNPGKDHIINLSWTNPADSNFSHVRISNSPSLNSYAIMLDPGVNSFMTEVHPTGEHYFICVDKQGNLPKGVSYHIDRPDWL